MEFERLQKIFYKDDTLSNIIGYLKKLAINTPPHKFINFEPYEQIPGFRKKILKSDDCAKYNSQTNKIEIFKEAMTSKFVNDSEKFHANSFHRLLFNSLKSTDFLTLTFIHEIAHYIQHQDFKIQQQLLNNPQNNSINNFINKTLFYNTPEEICKLSLPNESEPDSKSRKDNNEHLHRIITEGFADSFSYIIFNQTSHDKKNALEVLHNHLNARKVSREAATEYYFTDELLVKFLDDLKNGKQFKNLSEIKDYINQQIENYIPKFIEERLNKDDNTSLLMNKRYLGYISKRLQVNNIEELYIKLEDIGIFKKVLHKDNKPKFNFNDKDFQYGIQIAQSFITEVKLPHFSQSVLPEKKQSIKNISSLRDKLLNNPNSNPKNKI